MVVGTNLVAVLYHPRADYQDFCTKEAEAKATVSVQNILAQTSNFELERKRKEQEIENLKLKGQAEAEAIKLRAKSLEEIKFPTVVTSNDLKVLGIDSLIQEATKSAGK